MHKTVLDPHYREQLCFALLPKPGSLRGQNPWRSWRWGKTVEYCLFSKVWSWRWGKQWNIACSAKSERHWSS